jgi:hypothetical protein
MRRTGAAWLEELSPNKHIDARHLYRKYPTIDIYSRQFPLPPPPPVRSRMLHFTSGRDIPPPSCKVSARTPRFLSILLAFRPWSLPVPPPPPPPEHATCPPNTQLAPRTRNLPSHFESPLQCHIPRRCPSCLPSSRSSFAIVAVTTPSPPPQLHSSSSAT